MRWGKDEIIIFTVSKVEAEDIVWIGFKVRFFVFFFLGIYKWGRLGLLSRYLIILGFFYIGSKIDIRDRNGGD